MPKLSVLLPTASAARLHAQGPRELAWGREGYAGWGAQKAGLDKVGLHWPDLGRVGSGWPSDMYNNQ